MVNGWDNKKLKETALASVEIGVKYIDLTPSADDFAPCPYCGGKAEYDPETGKVVCCDCGASSNADVWNNRVRGC